MVGNMGFLGRVARVQRFSQALGLSFMVNKTLTHWLRSGPRVIAHKVFLRVCNTANLAVATQTMTVITGINNKKT